MWKLHLSLTITIALLFTGCAIVNTNAKLIPNTEIEQKKSFYVVLLDTDKRDLASQIAEVLKEKGFNATSGTLENSPSDIDVIVTYEDRWFWDMSNYLIKLDIQFRNAKNMYPYVTGETIRTSLARKNPKAVAKETIDKMLHKLTKKDEK